MCLLYLFVLYPLPDESQEMDEWAHCMRSTQLKLRNEK
jgi:hypothetical protein